MIDFDVRLSKSQFHMCKSAELAAQPRGRSAIDRGSGWDERGNSQSVGKNWSSYQEVVSVLYESCGRQVLAGVIE